MDRVSLCCWWWATLVLLHTCCARGQQNSSTTLAHSSPPTAATTSVPTPVVVVSQCNKSDGGQSMSARFCRFQSALELVRRRAGNHAEHNSADDNAKYISESLDDAEELANEFDGDELTDNDVSVASEWVSYILTLSESANIHAQPASRNRLLRLLPKFFQSNNVAKTHLSSTQPNFAITLEHVRTSQHYPGATFIVSNSSKSNLTNVTTQLITGRRDLASLAALAPIVAVVLPENITSYSTEAATASSSFSFATVAVQFSVMTDTAMLEVNETAEFGANNFTLSSAVVSSQVGNSTVSGLRAPVSIVFTGTQGGSNATCVFWSFDLNDGYGGWSSAGCWLNSSSGDVYACQCDHLTTFALLLLLSTGTTPTQPPRARPYSPRIGVGIGSALLLLTILCLLSIKSLRQDTGNLLLAHYCAVLLVSGIVTILNFIFEPTRTVCIVVNSLMQYLGLSLYCWALVQAIYFYYVVVVVFYKTISHLLLKAMMFSYGVPAVICLVTMASDSFQMTGYFPAEGSTPTLCNLRFFYESLVSVVIPVTVVFLINLTIFVRIIRVAMQHNSQNKRFSLGEQHHQHNKNQQAADIARQTRFLRSSLGTFFVLGLGWIGGLAALAFTEVNHIFAALQALVGAAIFVLKILLAEPVRKAVVLKLAVGKTRRKSGVVIPGKARPRSSGLLKSSPVTSDSSAKEDITTSNTILYREFSV